MLGVANFCLICMDTKPIEEIFRTKTCSHLFCTDCISKYVAAKLQDNISMIKCPDLNCTAALERQICRSIVPKEVFDRWENARRLCAQCNVAWHGGISCDEFKNLSKEERSREDILVMELAKKNNWRRCPNCRIYVEKTEGCRHIICRCGFQFCYGCGQHWRDSHNTCR